MPDDDELASEPTPIDPETHANLQLENALLRAGVDLDTDQGKLIAAANANGEPDVDKIRSQWELVKPQPAPVEETPPERIEGEASQGEERRVLAASSTIEPDPTEKDPRQESMRVGREVLSPTDPYQRAGTNVDAIATALHMRIDAAATGDTRVIPER